jgi:hypothetical protein
MLTVVLVGRSGRNIRNSHGVEISKISEVELTGKLSGLDCTKD